jgi:putative ABC transport system permease protein
MYWLRRLMLLLPAQRRRRERELQEELQANLSLAVRDAAESGLSAEEAERSARRDFGNLTRAREEARSFWLPGWDSISQDLRFATRTLLRNRVFSLIAILSLALGIGAATALFSVVNTVVLKPLAYREPGRLLLVREVLPPLAHIYPSMPVNFQHFRFWRDEARTFESLSAIVPASVTMHSRDEALTVGAARVTVNLFGLLGVQPQLGRVFHNEEEDPGKGSVIVISDALWRRQFGGSPSIIGQTVRLGDAPHSIIGVLRPDFRFPKKDDLGPLASLAEQTEIFLPIQDFSPGWGGDYDYIVFGRLRPGVTQAEAVADLNVLESRIAEEHKLNYGLSIQVRPLQEAISSPVRASLAVLLAAVLLLVLIVCVNLANLLLARGSARAREFSMRIALGASRARLLTSALMETLLLSAIGGGLGMLAAHAALGVFVQTAPIGLPRLDEVAIDGRVLAFSLALTLFCGALFGLIPALRLSHSDPQAALRSESATVSSSRRALHLREWLVGAEVTLGTVLLVLAALLVSSLWHVLRVDRGFSAEKSIDVRLSMPARYSEPKARAAFFDLAADRFRGLPEVQAVAAASKVPLTGESNVNNVRLSGADSGALDPETKEMVMVNIRFISQDYFKALNIPIIEGRAIEAADRDRNVAVVSRRLAAKLWPGQTPIGKVLSSGTHVSNAEIVGIVADVHTTRLERDPTLMIYAPFWRNPHQVAGFVVRATADPVSVMDGVRRTLQSIEAGIPAPKMRSMDEIVSESVSQRRFQMTVAVAFAASALLLAALGIYGVVAYGITLRRREIGIRIALGARTSQVRRLILWQGLRPVLAGTVSGILIALAAGHFIRALLYGVEFTDGLILVSVAAALTLVATAACLMPAHSASTIDPASVLRCE